jgi:hypothetical protein
MMNKRHHTALAWPWRLVRVFPPLAAIVLVFVLVTSASAAQLINQDFPISFSAVNPCNGENVAVSGVLHFTEFQTVGASGNVLTGNHQNLHLTGVGDQGNTYVGNLETNNVFNTQNGMELTSTLSQPLISQGSAPNFQVHAIVHVTINPNGTQTAFVDHFTATCLG